MFFLMLSILQKKYDSAHVNGSNRGIGPGCRLVIALCYWREYRCMRQMALDFDVSLSTICNSITWVEDTLKESKEFQLEDIETEIEKYLENHDEIAFIIGDVEEQRIEIPSKNQKEYYSGKKKQHTVKNQIIIIGKIKKIINIFHAKGTVHDYQMLKNSNVIEILEKRKIKSLFDSGYQGIQKLLTNAVIPYKNSKYHKLSDEEKEFNTNLSKERVEIEHINREIKKFRIMKDVYRSHLDRYEFRLTIICCLYNLNYC